MSNVSLTRFGGEVPRLGKEVLPDNAASIAANCLLLSGELRGLHTPVGLYEFVSGGTITRAFSLPAAGIYPATWIGFTEPSTNFLKGPLVNDAWDRYYISSDVDEPRMTTRDDIEAANPDFTLGIPAPTNTMTVTPGTGIGKTVTRAYVYTLVSPYGEEGPVSEPVIAEGPDDATWALANMDTSLPAGDRPSITGWSKRIYRTVTGVSGTAAYHFVYEETNFSGLSSYNDSNATDDVALNDTCESFYWQPPPSTLRGIVAHPSGFLVGYDGRDIYFSEPYRPHAWPPGYVLSTEHDIVGLGVFGNSVAVMTTGFPYIISGSHPGAMVSIKHNASEPCLSTKSIVEMPFGVYYASQNGLQLLTAGGVQNATQQLITRDEWETQYDLSTLAAARYNDYYIGFYTDTDGFMFAPSEPNAVFTQLRDHWNIDSLQTDTETGKTVVLKDNVVSEWNHPQGESKLYTWKSKRFVLPRPDNWGAFRVYSYILDEEIADGDARVAFNDERITYPLDTLASTTLGTARKYGIPNSSQYENKSPLGGTVLASLSSIYSVSFNLYADGELVFTGLVDSDNMFRLPTGYKATRYEIEIIGNAPVTSVKVASNGKELARI